MALKLWLPLQGDLHNQGLYNLPDPSVSSVTWDPNGKLGYCSNKTAIWHLQNEIVENIWSIAIWINNKSGSWSSSNNIIFCKNASTSEGHIYFSIKGGTQFIVGVNKYTENSYAFNFEANKWYHLAATYNGYTLKMYINGEEVKSVVDTTEYVEGRNNIGLCCRSANTSGTSRTGQISAYYCNDLRLYDHALSKTEIKEISQGLILHYKLDGILGGLNPNLFKSIPKAYSSSSYGAYDLYLTENLVEGETYTVQLWDITISHTGKIAGNNLGISLYWGGGSVNLGSWSGSIFSTGHADYVSKTITITSTQASHTQAANAWLRLYNSVPLVDGTKYMKIGKWKIEKGSIATPWCPTVEEIGIDTTKIIDSSGYNNHGTITGILTTSNTGGRYNSCTYIDSGNINYITTPILNLPGDAITLNFWFKSTNTSPGSNYHMPLEGTANSNQSYECSIYKTGYYRSGLVVDGVRKVDNCTSTKLTDGNWHMCTTTYDGTTIKRYVDAISEKDTTVTGTLVTSTAFVLGHYGSRTSYYSKESYESDVRIYTTALSQQDIEELYHTSLKIDNFNKIHTFELEEKDNSSIKINKNGILLTENEFIQNTKSAFYKDKRIEAKEFIER